MFAKHFFFFFSIFYTQFFPLWLHPCHCHSFLALSLFLSFFLLTISFCQRDVCKDTALGTHWVKPDVRCRIRRWVEAQAVSSCFPAQIILNLPISTHVWELYLFIYFFLFKFMNFLPLSALFWLFVFWVAWTEGALCFHYRTLLFSQISCFTRNLPLL